MTKTTILMEQDGNSPSLAWTTKLLSTRHEDGTFSLEVVEDCAFGLVTEEVATGIASPEQLIPALMSISGWSELRIDRGDIARTIAPRMAELDSGFAAARSASCNGRRTSSR